MNKQELLNKIFNSRWNRSESSKAAYIIEKFYLHGGFDGLYNLIFQLKEKMGEYKEHRFSTYYSSDLLETLQDARVNLTKEDFRNYIFENPNIISNKHNFLKLEEFGMLKYYDEFDTNFRGDIVKLHTIGDINIVETSLEGETYFNEGEFSNRFSSLKEALIYKIYNGKFYDTLMTLYNSVD